MPDAPVALFIFNRPDLAAGAVESIRPSAPSRLVIVADGPRPDRPGEAARCLQARDAAMSRVDWRCDVDLVSSDVNLGCGARLSSGIGHVLEKYGRAVIIEDDCRPDPTFFPYANQLLDRYANDERVGHIGGTSLGGRSSIASYRFSSLPLPWGWATWQRAWNGVDLAMPSWKELGEPKFFAPLTRSRRIRQFLFEVFDAAARGRLDTWDVQWWYHSMRRGYLSAQPTVNLVRNIGFGADATHTTSTQPFMRIPDPVPMTFPLKHPATVEADMRADRAFLRRYASRRSQLANRARHARARVAAALPGRASIHT